MKCAYDAESLSRYLEKNLAPEDMNAATEHIEE